MNKFEMKKPSLLSIADWKEIYPKYTMKQISELMGCGETTVHKWIIRAGIEVTKKNRNERSQEHRNKLSIANSGKVKDKNGQYKICKNCLKEFYVIPARIKTANYCSYKCRGNDVQKKYTGENHPSYVANAIRKKICEGCWNEYLHKPPKPLTSFLLSKYCSRLCADSFGFRYKGETHPNFKGDESRRRSRNHQDSRWALKVLNRDGYKCMRCNVSGQIATLQAHHIYPYEMFPDKRSDIENGVTLCSKCHWEVHDILDINYIVTDKKPNQKKDLLVDGLLIETKVFGKDSRKWHGNCYWCAKEIIKRLSDVAGRTTAFCGRSCASKHRRAFGNYRKTDISLIPKTAREGSSQIKLN